MVWPKETKNMLIHIQNFGESFRAAYSCGLKCDESNVYRYQ